MTNKQKEEILRHLKKTLSPRRLKHSMSVGDLAAKLAKKHGWDPEKARWAGRLHDCAKEWSPNQLRRYAVKNKLAIPSKNFILKERPSLLHAYVGADFARSKNWGVTADMARAIRSHTLGRGGMKLEEKILFVADFASPDRKYPSAAKVRRLALKNFKEGFRMAVHKKISFQLKLNKPLHPNAISLWNDAALGFGQ